MRAGKPPDVVSARPGPYDRRMQPDKNKLFLLGLGAQKAGTTWLYSYLASASNVATDGVKEYHVWDVHHLPDTTNGRVSRQDSTPDLARRIQYALQQDPSGYFRYFDTFLEKSGRQVSCDITPTYAGLGSAVLASVREGFAQRGIATRAIFLMRDPVERCWSAARMQGRLRAGDAAVTDEQVLAHVERPGAQQRTRYDLTIGEMEKAFAARRHLRRPVRGNVPSGTHRTPVRTSAASRRARNWRKTR